MRQWGWGDLSVSSSAAPGAGSLSQLATSVELYFPELRTSRLCTRLLKGQASV